MNGVSVAFVRVDPLPASTIALEDCTTGCVHATFTVTTPVGGFLFAQAMLIDGRGAACSFDSSIGAIKVDAHAQPTFTVDLKPYIAPFDPRDDDECTSPFAPAGQRPSWQTARIRLVIRIYAAGEVRAPPLEADLRFDLPYTFSGPPLSLRATVPVITSLEWEWVGVGKDRLRTTCEVFDEDGDPLSISLTIETEACLAAGNCWTASRSFPAQKQIGQVYFSDEYLGSRSIDFGQILQGQLVCTVEDAHGQHARRSTRLCIHGPETGTCPAG